MNAERLSKIEEICHAVLDLSPKARPAFLKKVSGDDDDLRGEVESLLSFADVSSSLIDTPPIDVAAEIFAKRKSRPIVGTKIRQYEIISQIGIGGMGEVFLAKDTHLERRVAVKFITADFGQDTERLRRFINEAKTASSLNHPNIITVHEIGKAKKTPFIATEFIDGKTLRKEISENSLSIDEILNIASQVGEALNAAHSAGIIHRDIKPENIMRRKDGLVKVLDFGLAKLLGSGEWGVESGEWRVKPHSTPDSRLPNSQLPNPSLLMGTIAYLSPEQAGGKAPDSRSDIWSLGVVLYEVCSGKQPFAGESTNELIASILKNEPAPLGQEMPEELNRIIGKALQKNADDRYQNAQDFLFEVKNLRNELQFAKEIERSGISNSAIGVTSLGESNIKGRKFGAIASLAFLVAISVLAFFYFNRSPILTDQDTVLIADFENLTDDPVFTGTLLQGLALELAQSPFLRIIPEADVKETLRLMGDLGDKNMTREIAREICLRQNLKVFITGSFVPLGKFYLVTLQVVSAQTGQTIFSAQNLDAVRTPSAAEWSRAPGAGWPRRESTGST